MRSNTVPVEGSARDDFITLRSSVLFGHVDVTLTGRINGGQLILASSSSSGKTESVTFLPGTKETFNAWSAEWQASLWASYHLGKGTPESDEAQASRASREGTPPEPRDPSAVVAGTLLTEKTKTLSEGIAKLERFSELYDLKHFGEKLTLMQRRVETLRAASSSGNSSCITLQNQSDSLNDDLTVMIGYRTGLRLHSDGLEPLIRDLKTFCATVERQEAAFETAARNDSEHTIPVETVAATVERARATRAELDAAITRAHARWKDADDKARSYEEGARTLVNESQAIVATANCR